jgi:hypothetical protein
MSAPSFIAGVVKKHQPKDNRDQSHCCASTPDSESNRENKGEIHSLKLPLVSHVTCFQLLVIIFFFAFYQTLFFLECLGVNIVFGYLKIVIALLHVQFFCQFFSRYGSVLLDHNQCYCAEVICATLHRLETTYCIKHLLCGTTVLCY